MSQHHNRSYRVLQTGRAGFGEWIKKNSTGIRVVPTDDAELMGHVLKETQHEVRLGVCQGFVRDRFEIERVQVWAVIAVPKNRIRDSHFMAVGRLVA